MLIESMDSYILRGSKRSRRFDFIHFGRFRSSHELSLENWKQIVYVYSTRRFFLIFFSLSSLRFTSNVVKTKFDLFTFSGKKEREGTGTFD